MWYEMYHTSEEQQCDHFPVWFMRACSPPKKFHDVFTKQGVKQISGLKNNICEGRLPPEIGNGHFYWVRIKSDIITARPEGHYFITVLQSIDLSQVGSYLWLSQCQLRPREGVIVPLDQRSTETKFVSSFLMVNIE